MTYSSNLASRTTTNQSVEAESLNFEDPTLQLVQQIVTAADERKGGDIAILEVTEVSTLADYFVLVTGFSRVQVRAIARAIEDQVKETLQRPPRRLEGLQESTWILMDFEDVVVHIQMPQEREFYNLEAFWGHAKRFPPEVFVSAA